MVPGIVCFLQILLFVCVFGLCLLVEASDVCGLSVSQLIGNRGCVSVGTLWRRPGGWRADLVFLSPKCLLQVFKRSLSVFAWSVERNRGTHYACHRPVRPAAEGPETAVICRPGVPLAAFLHPPSLTRVFSSLDLFILSSAGEGRKREARCCAGGLSTRSLAFKSPAPFSRGTHHLLASPDLAALLQPPARRPLRSAKAAATRVCFVCRNHPRLGFSLAYAHLRGLWKGER